MKKLLVLLISKLKVIYLICITLFFAYIFMYEYVATGNGIIYKINRYTHEAYYTTPSTDEWGKIKPYKRGEYDDLLDQIKK